MILVAQGKKIEARVIGNWASRAKVFDILVLGAGSCAVCCVLCAAWVKIPGVWVRQLVARFGGMSKVLILDTQMSIVSCLWHAQSVDEVYQIIWFLFITACRCVGRKIDDFGGPRQPRGTEGTGPNGLAREGF